MRIRYQIVVLCVTLLAMQQTAAQSHEGHQHHQPLPKTWSSQPLLVKPQGRGSRTVKSLKPVNLSANRMRVFPSTEPGEGGASWEVPLEGDKAKIASRDSKQGGYHWVSARAESGNSVRIASTVTYFSNPGPAPRAMLKQNKSELEIRPMRLPREHQRYRADETWPFQLLYQGEPVTDTEVTFESRNGSRFIYSTDASGQFEVEFPSDFPEVNTETKGNGGHRHGRRKSDFVLAAQLEQGERHLLSAFNYHYTPGAYADKNLSLGIGMAVLGMFAAGPLLRNKKKDKKGEQS
ncbi:MAG: DUF4198 domain-containing protein [Gammaproteobacteria bacterium]|nr:MAG: DUF4198 domain-containing protein [Gammaproteobacteria bacterium]